MLWPHEIVIHQEEPRTNATSIGSDNGSKEYSRYLMEVRVPLSSLQRSVHLWPFMVVPPQNIMLNEVTGSRTFSIPLHICNMCSGCTCKRHRVPMVGLPIPLFYGKCQ